MNLKLRETLLINDVRWMVTLEVCFIFPAAKWVFYFVKRQHLRKTRNPISETSLPNSKDFMSLIVFVFAFHHKSRFIHNFETLVFVPVLRFSHKARVGGFKTIMCRGSLNETHEKFMNEKKLILCCFRFLRCNHQLSRFTIASEWNTTIIDVHE